MNANAATLSDITVLSTAALAIEEVTIDLRNRTRVDSSVGPYALMTERVEARRRSVEADQVAWDSMYRLYNKACERFRDLALVPDDSALRAKALKAKIATLQTV